MMVKRSDGSTHVMFEGKSLCFQLPAVVFDSLTLVVSPLLAIMKDQVDFLKSKGISAERLDSTLDKGEYKRVLKALRECTIKILYVSPGTMIIITTTHNIASNHTTSRDIT